MKLMVEATSLDIEKYQQHDIQALVYGLKDFSVHMGSYLEIDELKDLMKKKENLEIFISINKVLFDEEMDTLASILKEIDKLEIKGIFYYDLAMLTLSKELNLKTDLVWNQTHMVTNYQTCAYYQKQGVNYAFLSSEITLDEMLEIKKETSMKSIAMVYGYLVSAFSYRHLLSNYYEFLNQEKKGELSILEPVSKQKYLVREEKQGTTFYRGEILNGAEAYLTMLDTIDYAYFREYHISSEEFFLVVDAFASVKNQVLNEKEKEEWLEKVNSLIPSTYTGFFYQKTIYKVKKS